MAITNFQLRAKVDRLYAALPIILGNDALEEYRKRFDNEGSKDRPEIKFRFYDLIEYLGNRKLTSNFPKHISLDEENKIHARECLLALEKLLKKHRFPTTTAVVNQWFIDACLECGFDEDTAKKLKKEKIVGLRGLTKTHFLEPLSRATKKEPRILEIIVEACAREDTLHPLALVSILRKIPQRTSAEINWEKIRDIVKLPGKSTTINSYLDYHFANPEAPVEALRYMHMFTKKNRALGYILRRYIASGANKHVFEAEDPKYPEDKPVVKIFNLREIKEYMERRGNIVLDDILFHEKRAAHITRITRNPNINMVRSIGSLDESGTYYMIEDKFDETLEDYVEKWKGEQGNEMGIPGALSLVREICNGVDSLHKESLVHGDLKASNIGLVHGKKKTTILDGKDVIRKREVRITDCGYATSFKYNPKDKTFSFAGLSIRAPELYSEDRLVQPTAKSDIWAIGVLTYYILTGEYPFVHPSKTEREQSWREAEKKILEDIKYKLADPNKRLFNRREFVNQFYAKFLHSNPKIFINACLQLEPEKRPHIVELTLIEESILPYLNL